MRIKNVQISFEDIYNHVSDSMEKQDCKLVSLLDEHINLDELIPYEFKLAFNKRMGRARIYHLDSFLWFIILKKLFGFSQNTQMLNVLRCSRELRDLCGFSKVPDPSQISRFYSDYFKYIVKMFDRLVDITEPICRQINSKKADYLIFDTTGIEAKVSENNPKFFNAKLKQAKSLSKNNPDFNPYIAVYSSLPAKSETNSDFRQQYVNGHFCYALKAGIVTNGLGIVRHISVFDNDFKSSRTNNPDSDKELGDSAALNIVLFDFFHSHPNTKFSTFIGDSAFDSYDNYSLLKNRFGFSRAVIPMNLRNSKTSDALFDSDGTPVCPLDRSKFTFLGKSGGKNRSVRFKWVCPKSVVIPKSSGRICTCDSPCTQSSYGKCVYTYPDKDFRLYPGVPRNSKHWDNIYKNRVSIERTINILKDSFALADNRSFRTVSLKADLYLSGIVQLIGVILADKLNKQHLFKSIRKLMAC